MDTIIIPDNDIYKLIQEKKLMPDDFATKLKLRPKRGHQECELDIQGNNEGTYCLILRISLYNTLDFSAILGYKVPKSNQLFRLRRYNGKSHEHTNHIEKEKFYDFHIHQATERYQKIGSDEDSYAEPTDRFIDINQAISCMFSDCGFKLPSSKQTKLFEGSGIWI
jgi:hypothetical protein